VRTGSLLVPLTLLVGLTIAVAPSWAGPPVAAPALPPAVTPVPVTPTPPVAATPTPAPPTTLVVPEGGVLLMPAHAAPAPAPANTGRRRIGKHGQGDEADPTDPANAKQWRIMPWPTITCMGCSNFCTEFRFAWGSCRAFYGEGRYNPNIGVTYRP
jgi:hypothetical protein